MDEILETLDSGDLDETDKIKSLRNQAHHILKTPNPTSPNQQNLPSTLHTLLTQIIKPLFSASQNPALTASGRKNLVSTPSIPSRFGTDSIIDKPQWKTPWTVPLLKWILTQHTTASLPDSEQRKSAIEAHFHLLVPAILHLIDDSEIDFKAAGCDCLTMLCAATVDVETDITRRTGLADVFFDALRHCFHHLPPLTPEQESLALMKAVYPAYFAVVRARFQVLDATVEAAMAVDESVGKDARGLDPQSAAEQQQEEEEEIITIAKNPRQQSQPPTASPSPQHRSPLQTTTTAKPHLTPSQLTHESTLKRKTLTTLLRHSLLHGLAHLQTSTPQTTTTQSTTSPALTTYLLTQLPTLLRHLSLSASSHLQSILPVVWGILRDPFATASPEMLGAAVDAVRGVVQVCWVRVRQKWWVEVVGGLVAAWLNCRDEVEALSVREVERRVGLEGVVRSIGVVVGLVREVVGEGEFGPVAARLVEEEEELKGLFKLDDDGSVGGAGDLR